MSTFIDQYRVSSESKEILRILQKSSLSQENMLWQKLGGERVILTISHLEINFSSRDVVIYCEDGFQLIQAKEPLYVKLYYHATVFKVSDYRICGQEMTFEIPKEVRTPELRSGPRLEFDQSEAKTITLVPYLPKKKQRAEEMKVQVSDISKNGFGLLISDQNKAFIRNNKILWILKFGETYLETPILSEVVYMSSEFYSFKDRTYKFGIKTSLEIPINVLKGIFS